MLNFTTQASPEIPLYSRLINTVFYLALVPVATVGNILAIAVVIYIIKHHRTRRFIPDMGLGVLGSVDLFSVVCVHSLTMVAMGQGWVTLPNEMCVFQAFSSSVYLKLQFLVQVTISLDRYFALVRPLRYHSVSSVKTMKIVLSVIFVFSVGTTALTMAFAVDDIMPLETWQFCIYEWRLRSAGDYALVSIFGFLFFLGFVSFIGSNVSLVRILWRYHARRGDSVLREISHAVDVMKRDTKSPKTPRIGLPDWKEPSSPNGNLVQNVGAINGAKNIQSSAMMGHNGGLGGLHEGCVINARGNEIKSWAMNGERAHGSMLNQFTEGNNQSGTAANNRPNSQVWHANSMLMYPSSGNSRNSVSKGLTLDMPAGASSYVSIRGHGVEWKIGGSDIEESSALLYSEHRSASPQNSITPLDQSPNTRTSFLADNSDQDLGALLNTPDEQMGTNAFVNATCVPFPPQSPSKLSVSPLNLLGREANQMLPIPSMHKSLSTDNNVMPKIVLASIPKSKSFDATPYHSNPTESSGNQVIPKIRTPSLSSPTKVWPISNASRERSNKDIPSLPKKVQPNGRDHAPSSAGRTHLASSNASSTRHVQLAYFQHQVKRVLRKIQKKANKQKKEMVLAKLVLLCAGTFIVTWLPYVVSMHSILDDVHVMLVIVMTRDIVSALIETFTSIPRTVNLYDKLGHSYLVFKTSCFTRVSKLKIYLFTAFCPRKKARCKNSRVECLLRLCLIA